MSLFKLSAVAEVVVMDEGERSHSEIAGVLDDLEEKRRRIFNFHFMKFEQEKGRILYTKGLEIVKHVVDADMCPGYGGTYLN